MRRGVLQQRFHLHDPEGLGFLLGEVLNETIRLEPCDDGVGWTEVGSHRSFDSRPGTRPTPDVGEVEVRCFEGVPPVGTKGTTTTRAFRAVKDADEDGAFATDVTEDVVVAYEVIEHRIVVRWEVVEP